VALKSASRARMIVLAPPGPVGLVSLNYLLCPVKPDSSSSCWEELAQESSADNIVPRRTLIPATRPLRTNDPCECLVT